MLPIRNISYLLPMCCSFWEKCKNSPKTDLGCSTPLKVLQYQTDHTVFVKTIPLRFLFLIIIYKVVNFDILAAILKKKTPILRQLMENNLNLNYPVVLFVQDNDQIWSKFALKWWNYNIYNVLAAILKKAPSWLYPASLFLQAPWFQ